MAACILGISPGAIAFYFPDAPCLVRTYGVDERDAWPELIAQMAPTLAVVEAGTAIDAIAGCAIPIDVVAPSAWREHFRLSRDSDAALALARRIWPKARAFSDGQSPRAEAALLARWHAEQRDMLATRHGNALAYDFL